jgi:hypothetical protein
MREWKLEEDRSMSHCRNHRTHRPRTCRCHLTQGHSCFTYSKVIVTYHRTRVVTYRLLVVLILVPLQPVSCEVLKSEAGEETGGPGRTTEGQDGGRSQHSN